ncbi:MAG: DUF1732 domain-containing protein [Candidatus Omnitrophota bacterium]
MINSMTGFGQATGQNKHARVNIEIKSLNHRFLEVVAHLPEGYSFLESVLKKEIKRRIQRGRLTVILNIAPSGEPKTFVLNMSLAKKYQASFNKLKSALHLVGELSPEKLINLSGVISLREPGDFPVGEIISLVKKTFKTTLEKLIRMRRQEGREIFRELSSIAAQMERDLEFIGLRFREISEAKKAELSDEDFGLFLKSQDVTEELARLKFHLKSIKAGMQRASGCQGKELDFISQEIQREINTLGAKLLDTKVSQKAVLIKSGVDKLREQMQNVE